MFSGERLLCCGGEESGDGCHFLRICSPAIPQTMTINFSNFQVMTHDPVPIPPTSHSQAAQSLGHRIASRTAGPAGENNIAAMAPCTWCSREPTTKASDETWGGKHCFNICGLAYVCVCVFYRTSAHMMSEFWHGTAVTPGG